MSLACRLLTTAWQTAATPRWRSFRRALATPAATQERLLARLLRANRDTWFGRRHGFAAMRGVEDFRRRVPASGWDDYREAVDRIRHGERGVLTAAPVTRLVPSSGSAAARKLVPYTAELLAGFQAGISPWIVDLFRRRPQLKTGPGYWSVSPAIARGDETSALPIGFDDDSAYLGRGLDGLVARSLAVPSAVRHLAAGDGFLYATALLLLARDDLSLASVWHPSFFSRILDAARREWPRLLADLARGTLTLAAADRPTTAERDARRRLAASLAPRPERARRLAAIGADGPAAWWPRLGLVSCWADGPAEPAAAALARRLPGVEIEPKGLVATEAIVSLPFAGRHPMAVRSHFFELIDDAGRSRLLDEVEGGGSYSLLVTNGGGLYRYRLHDRVRVTGFLDSTPCLRFVGKEETVSDQRGEKLNGIFVERALRRAFAAAGGPSGARLVDHPFVLLAPEGRADDAMGYVLFVEPGEAAASDGAALARLAAALDGALADNPHYELCRRLGQLEAVRAVQVRDGAAGFARRCRREDGLRAGDVKPVWLSPRSGWGEWLQVDAAASGGADRPLDPG